MSDKKRQSKKTSKNQSWELQDQFLKADMDRLDHQEYFQPGFSCPDLDSFFQSLVAKKNVKENKEIVNLFYNRLLDEEKLTQKDIYVRLKWLVYQHSMMPKLDQKSPLFPYILKALQFYQDDLQEIAENLKGYDKYLMKIIFRPYLQYLIKYCMLKIPEEKSFKSSSIISKKQNSMSSNSQSSKENRNQNIQTNKKNPKCQIIQPTKEQIFTLHKIKNESQTHNSSENSVEQFSANKKNKRGNEEIESIFCQKMIKWYTIFNFVTSSIENFQQPLLEVKNFFAEEYPYLGKICQLIINDLNSQIFKLKYMFRSLKKCDVTNIEMNELQKKLKNFQRNHQSLAKNSLVNIQIDYSNQQVQQFLCSPLKKMSILSPISRKHPTFGI